ncbi:hypothetical protein [Mycetocola zhadangensis]|uniref:hypothetical protein n=1 Tax=Mycetocola zhadangensis TaxID=1164595 RepID=UPI000EF5B535|nr:hypothetical protein [Mycetocola zhadangensis]
MKLSTTMSMKGNNTGIAVPEEIITALRAGKRPAVTVIVNGLGGPPSLPVACVRVPSRFEGQRS